MRGAGALRGDNLEIAPHDVFRVLAVDDEPVVRQQLVFQIAALGHRVSAAASAGEAQEILRRTDPPPSTV